MHVTTSTHDLKHVALHLGSRCVRHPRKFPPPPPYTRSLEASLFLHRLHPLNRSSPGKALARILAILPVDEFLGRARAAQACSTHDLVSGPFDPPGRSLRHALTVTHRLGFGLVALRLGFGFVGLLPYLERRDLLIGSCLRSRNLCITNVT